MRLLDQVLNFVTDGWANGGKEDRHNFGNIVGYYHANTKDLAEIANEAKPKLLVLYHVQNCTSSLRPEALVEEIKRMVMTEK